jgi:tetrahydromethanopterin S-methyltransferase subunit A
MARIPDEALERLKREVSLVRLIEAQGLTLIVQDRRILSAERSDEGAAAARHCAAPVWERVAGDRSGGAREICSVRARGVKRGAH